MKLIAALACFLCIGCAPNLPTRYVFEHDIGDFTYRRYQRVTDVEFEISDNNSVRHVASYTKYDNGQLKAITALVTVYQKSDSLAADIYDQIQTLAGYEVHSRRIFRNWVWYLNSPDDHWILWINENHVVRVGSREQISDSVLRRYLRTYPSDLTKPNTDNAETWILDYNHLGSTPIERVNPDNAQEKKR